MTVAALRVWPSARAAPTRLRPGRDLVLESGATEAVRIPDGVLLDDFLDRAERERIEERARATTGAWIDAHRDALTLDGVDLTWIWEVELYRDAVLPVERLLAGVRRAVAALAPRELRLHGIDPATAAAIAAAEPIATVADGGGELTLRQDPPGLTRAQRLLVASGLGAPQLIRGDIRLIQHWSSAPVVDALAATGRHAPVLDAAALPPVGARALAGLAWRGGWLGVPGARRRRRSERRVVEALATLAGDRRDSRDALVHARATALLDRRARDTLALVDRNARAFSTDRVRLVVAPFDSVASVRAVLVAARPAGVPSLVVQHGYAPEPNDPDKGQADHVAVWSRRDADEARRRFGADAHVTGNPAAPAAAAARRTSAPRPRTLLLVQSPTLYSVRWGARVSQRFVAVALDALARARPGGEAILRPHPMETDPEALLRAAGRDTGVRVTVDARSPIGDLLERCDLCVGGVSTAILQAAVAGLPVVFLDVTDSALPAPFDGSSEVPAATGADGLADAISAALAVPDVRGVAALGEALGVRPGADERLARLIDRLASG